MDPLTVQVDAPMTDVDSILPALPRLGHSKRVTSTTPPSDGSFNVASFTPTPPTSVSPDNASLASDHEVQTPKTTAVLCRTLDDPTPKLLLSVGFDGVMDSEHQLTPPTREGSTSAGQHMAAFDVSRTEELATLRLADGVSVRQEAQTRNEPSSESTTEPSSDLDVQAQLERQLMREAELRVQSDPASLDAIQPELAAENDITEEGTTSTEPAADPSTTIAESSPPKRSQRARASLPTYNLAKLLGTDIHGRRASKGDTVQPKNKKRRRTLATDTFDGEEATASGAIEESSADDAADASFEAAVEEAVEEINDMVAQKGRAPSHPQVQPGRQKRKYTRRTDKIKDEPQPKPEIVTRRTARLTGTEVPSAVILPLPSLRQRGKKAAEKGLSRLKRELLRLQDTKEYAKVEDEQTTIVHTYWSNGKFVDPRTIEGAEDNTRSSKRLKVADAAREEEKEVEEDETTVVEAVPEEVPEVKKRTAKIWLDKGLYAGQPTPADPHAGLTTQEKKKLAHVPELLYFSEKPNNTLPPPMFNGLRLLLHGRDFKLPYDICNPLPPGLPKPPNYRSLTKNRFIGDARQQWKKQRHGDGPSKCVCKPEDGCGESCYNKIMLYECEDNNCNAPDRCANRPFASLAERTKGGGQYRIGVEVFKTKDRGFGVRSNRCFQPREMIMEYTGEIITEEECLRRMDTVYKNNECYYLMSFSSKIVIDATTGSIARFVNHSCSPNCRMIKWVVSGQPRMALFAGNRPIMTGEELTYDYNFAPYSKDPQKCLCGADNCRGVLGPKIRDVKAAKTVAPAEEETTKKRSVLKATIKAGKRKLQELLGGEDDVYDDIEGASMNPTKKRKVNAATGSSSLSKSGLEMAKGAAKALKRSVSNVSLSAKAAMSSKPSASSTSTANAAQALPKKSPGRPKKVPTTVEGKVITSSKEAVALALELRGIPPTAIRRATTTTTSKASGSGSIARARTAVTTKSPALSFKNANGKGKVKSELKVKTTSGKETGSATKKGRKSSGYTPPDSPNDSIADQAQASSSRKKIPTRKVLESTTAGTASVTKPKATPQAKAKTKTVTKPAEVAKKQRSIIAMLKAAEAESSSDAGSVYMPNPKKPRTSLGKNASAKKSPKKSPGRPPSAKKTPTGKKASASIRVVPASPEGAENRPSTPVQSGIADVLASPDSALSSVHSTPEVSPLASASKSKLKLGPASRPASRMVTVRMPQPQIRPIERNLDVEDDDESA